MGVNGSTLGPEQHVSSGFPSFVIDDSKLGAEVGYLAYGGIMFGDTYKTIGMYATQDFRII